MIARPPVDCESGGINRDVEVYSAGIRIAASNDATNPTSTTRPIHSRRDHKRRNTFT